MNRTNGDSIGQDMYALARELYPICRSITGEGVRQTLRLLQKRIPLTVHEVPSGTDVFDWTVPKEWNVRDAWIKNDRGQKVVDFQKHNLHLVNYSVAVKQTLPLTELKKHLFTLPEKPDWIPYRTSYYKETWGFCLAHRDLLKLEDGNYQVCIDATLEPGHLTYGEHLVRGQSAEEVLISCHVCHPSLANDNLSGIALAVALAERLAAEPRRYSYRFLFIPGTIGSITWLALNEAAVSRIQHGLVLTCVGDAGKSTYKKTRRGHALIDRAMAHVFQHSGQDYEITEFIPYGYDERQYCSPGFNLAVGCLMRTPNGRYAEYHTSADNLDFIQPPWLADSFNKVWAALQVLEKNRVYVNQNPKGEPRLGKRGLYSSVGGQKQGAFNEMALLWVLNLSDGEYDLLSIAERSGMDFNLISQAAEALVQHGLLIERAGGPKDNSPGQVK
jgi:aminopeptidase-like protein